MITEKDHKVVSHDKNFLGTAVKYYVTKVGDGIVPYFTLRPQHKRMGKSDSQRFSDQ